MSANQRLTDAISKVQVLKLVSSSLDDFIANKKWGTLTIRVEIKSGDIKELGLSPEQTYRAPRAQTRH